MVTGKTKHMFNLNTALSLLNSIIHPYLCQVNVRRSSSEEKG